MFHESFTINSIASSLRTHYQELDRKRRTLGRGGTALWRVSPKWIFQMEAYCQMISHIGTALHQIHANPWMRLDVSPGNILQDNHVVQRADSDTVTKMGELTEGCEDFGHTCRGRLSPSRAVLTRSLDRQTFSLSGLCCLSVIRVCGIDNFCFSWKAKRLFADLFSPFGSVSSIASAVRLWENLIPPHFGNDQLHTLKNLRNRCGSVLVCFNRGVE
jgi:hypothetical protein